MRPVESRPLSARGNNAKRAARTWCVRARLDYWLLVAESKFLDDLPVSGQIRPPHVVEEPAALADHLQQPATPMVILLVRPEMLREIVDPLRQDRNLDTRAASVGAMRLVLLDRRCFLQCHVVYSPHPWRRSRPIG